MSEKEEETLPDVGGLWSSAVTVQARDADWSSYRDGGSDEFEFYEATECNGKDGKECGHICLSTEGLTCPECGADLYMEGPVMNCLWPLPSFNRDKDELAKALINLPVCVVEMTQSGEVGLALSGGGMNLAWELAEAYMRAGYVPPADIAESLPNLAGMELTPTHKWVIEGCRKTAQVMKNVGEGIVRLMDETEKRLAANSRERKRTRKPLATNAARKRKR